MNTSEGMDEISEDEEAGGEYIKGTRKRKIRITRSEKRKRSIRLKEILWILVDRSLL